jgi:hypothetical protein
MKISQTIPIGLIAVLSFKCGKPETTDIGKSKIKSMAVFKQFSTELGDNFSINDTLFLKYQIEYDSLGNLSHEVIRGGDVSDDSYYHNQYDNSGLLTNRYSTYKNDPRINTKDTFIYDNRRQLIKEIEILQPNDTVDVI